MNDEMHDGMSGVDNPVEVENEAQEAEQPGSEVEALRAQVQELQDKLLRTYADFDNLRRRTRQEKEELASYANSKLISDLLPALDNFTLALAASEHANDGAALLKGIEMVYRQLSGVLAQAGVSVMEPIGSPFDPNLHEAVGTSEVEGAEPGIVMEVLRTGYVLKDKVLRPAMVKISG